MAKSLRSKVKRTFRAKKREKGVYAVASAARLARLNSKLVAIAAKDAPIPEYSEPNDEETDVPADETAARTSSADDMVVDSGPAEEKRISTHGPRNSRRELWRASKGMTPRPAVKGMNRQGGLAARRKAGRSHRRR